MDPSLSENHVQVSFYTKDTRVAELPDSVFDVPTSATCENLNTLVNKTLETTNDEWSEKRFEFLVADTFLRTTLKEFIEEYHLETETVVRIECVLGLEPPKPLHDLPAPDWVSSVHVLPHHLIGTTYNGEIVVWDKQGKKLLENARDTTAYKCSVVVEPPQSSKSADGATLIVGGESQTLSVLDISAGGLVSARAVLKGHERSVEAAALNHDKTRLITGAFDSFLKVWNMEGDENCEKTTESADKSKKKKENYVTKTPMVTLGGHKDAVVSVQWATWNRAHCVSASWDHTIAVWDLELAGEVSRVRHSKAFTSIDINERSGLVISSSTDSVPRLYDTRSVEGSVVKQSFLGHHGWVSSVKWNPLRDNVFITASFDKSVRMWDIRSAKTSLFDLHGHTDRVLCADYGADEVIASGSADSTVKVFGPDMSNL